MNVRCWLHGHERYPGAVLHEPLHWHQHERCARCDQRLVYGYGGGPWLNAFDRLKGGRVAGNDPNAREGGYGEGRPPRVRCEARASTIRCAARPPSDD